jgi:aldose sugar dehydrogenase
MTAIRPFLWTRLAWYVAAGALLVLLPVLKYSEWWWRLPGGQRPALLIACTTFGIAALATLAFEHESSWAAVLRTFVRSLAVLGLCLAGVALLGRELPRYVLLGLVVCTIGIIPLSVSPPARARLAPYALGLIALLAAGLAVQRMSSRHEKTQRTHTSYVNTAFYTLQATSYEGRIPAPQTRGGGLDRVGTDSVLLGTGDGSLYLLDFPRGDGEPRVQTLQTRVPNNREQFAAAFGGSSHAPTRSSEYSEAGAPRVQTWRFRVADVITRSQGDRLQIFASHHHWKEEDGCFVVQVSMLDVPAAGFPANVEQAQWRTLYESSPCIALKGPQRKRGKNPFKGEEIGGRLALLDDQTLLLTLGDQGFSGLESLQAFSQDREADYGKTIRIDIATGAGAKFTLGHRNPQGLYVTPDGQIWETEHGSQGGDELNLLEAGVNYGWPLVTYGTDYGSPTWPVSRSQGKHDGFREPRYSWVPSIGVSQIIRLEESEPFAVWSGNFIVGSLSTRALYRLALAGGHIVFSEPIPLDRRVRDILELTDGRLLVWSDDAALVMIEPAKGNDGATLFATQCSGCHSNVDGMSHRLGPDLHGVLARDIASASGYDEYSAAMRAQQGPWTRERLDKFLAQPQDAVPGNGMGYAGLADAAQRKALIDYLEKSGSRR